MAYVDYDYYVNEFYGTAVEEDAFLPLAVRGSHLVDYYTTGRAQAARGEAMTAVKNAVCAFAEVLQDEDRLTAATFAADRTAQVKSETVGGWSRSYGSGAATAADLQLLAQRKREAARMYLGSTGLLKAEGLRGCSR